MYVYDNTVDDFILQRLRAQSFLVYLSLLFLFIRKIQKIYVSPTSKRAYNKKYLGEMRQKISLFTIYLSFRNAMTLSKKSSTLNCQFVVDDYIGQTNIQIYFDTKNIETKISTNYYWVYFLKSPILNLVQIVQMISCYRNLYNLFNVKCFTTVLTMFVVSQSQLKIINKYNVYLFFKRF